MTLRTNALLGAAFCLTLCASAAWTDDADDARRVAKQIADGERTIDHAKTYDNKSSRLEVLNVSIRQLQRARDLAGRHDGEAFKLLKTDAECDLVNALDDTADIYLARSAYPNAAKRVGEALDINPRDPRSLQLAARIEGAMHGGSYSYGGQSQRMADRRGGYSTPTLTPR